jgi:hypothetical protein
MNPVNNPYISRINKSEAVKICWMAFLVSNMANNREEASKVPKVKKIKLELMTVIKKLNCPNSCTDKNEIFSLVTAQPSSKFRICAR